MESAAGFKIVFFLLWPFLLLFLYYLIDKKGFKRFMGRFFEGFK